MLRRTFSMLIIFVFIFGCNMSVNRTIRIEDGETVRHSLNTVNGSVIIGKDCVIEGSCRSVNGSVLVGSRSKVGDLQSVNGGMGR